MGRILVVDDERDILILTKAILERAGHEVVTAKDGRECFEVLKRDSPDLILLDVMMPDENGWEVCKKIKENPKTSNIIVVIFTVRTSQDSINKSLKYAHADDQINKPFVTEELLKKIGDMLNK